MLMQNVLKQLSASSIASNLQDVPSNWSIISLYNTQTALVSFISICTVCPSITSLNGNNSQYKHYCKHFSLPFLVFIYIAFESMNNATDNTLPNSMGCDWPFCEDGGCHKNDFGIFWPFLQLVGNYKITIDRTDRDMLYERREIKKK